MSIWDWRESRKPKQPVMGEATRLLFLTKERKEQEDKIKKAIEKFDSET